MTRRTLNGALGWILEHPGAVVVLALLLVLAAAWLGAGVELRTSRSDMVPADDPDQRRLDQLQAEFSGEDPLVVAIEAAPGFELAPEELRSAADRVAEGLARAPEVEHVFHRLDPDWLLAYGLHLVPPDTLEGIVASLRDLVPLEEGRRAIDGWAGLDRAIAQSLRALVTAREERSDESRAQGFAIFEALLEAQRRFFADPDAFVAALEGMGLMDLAARASGTQSASQGYLGTYDGKTLFLLVAPRNTDDDLPALETFVAAVRERVEGVLAGIPNVDYGLTGSQALTVDEMAAVERDTWFTAALSLAGVSLLSLLAFRWRSHALVALGALVFGVAWAFGAVRLELGYLNLITSSFLSVLIGVGIAYMIHPISQYELEGGHTAEPGDAVRRAFRLTGAGVLVSAATTAGAFFAILLMDYRGFAEMGLVAGVGVLLCLLAALTILPALLVLYGRSRRRRQAPGHVSERTGGAMDRLWVDRASNVVCARPRAVVGVSLLLTIAAIVAAFGLRFELNVLDLVPQSAESRHYLERLTYASDLSPRINFVAAQDLAGLRRMAEQAAAEPEIARLESVLGLIPADPERSRTIVRELAELLATIELPEPAEPVRRAEVEGALQELEAALERVVSLATTFGHGDRLDPLRAVLRAAEQVRAEVAGAPAGIEDRWTAGEARLLRIVSGWIEELARRSSVEPPTPETLPPDLKSRLVTVRGRLVGYLHPRGDIFEPEFLERFNDATRRVSPEAAGWPIMFEVISGRIRGGFNEAFSAGLILVLGILVLSFRSLGSALLAMVPLGVGFVWMLGLMRLFDIDFNLANLVALPLVLGVGIDNGVHVVERWRSEGAQGMAAVISHVGRAILIASLTTMVGFGSLALASHRGMASLGMVLLIGVGTCLLASLILLPCLIVLLDRRERTLPGNDVPAVDTR